MAISKRSTSDNQNNKTVMKIVIAGLSVLLALFIVALIINLVRLSAANGRRDELAAQSEMLDALIDDNNARIDYYQTAEFIEQYAREYLDMVYRGEIIIEVE